MREVQNRILTHFFPRLSLLLRMKHETWATSVESVPWAPTSSSAKHHRSAEPRSRSAFFTSNLRLFPTEHCFLKANRFFSWRWMFFSAVWGEMQKKCNSPASEKKHLSIWDCHWTGCGYALSVKLKDSSFPLAWTFRKNTCGEKKTLLFCVPAKD